MKQLKKQVLIVGFCSLLSFVHYAQDVMHDIQDDFNMDVLFEGKGAYFLASDQTFKDIYNNGGGEFGLELSAKIIKHLYGFASVDFFNKSGETLDFLNSTKLHMTNWGIGLKYFIDIADHASFYVGLGAEPTYYYVTNKAPLVDDKQAGWTFGGIAKVGLIVDIPHDFFIDFFVDYSFVHTGNGFTPLNNNVQNNNANLNGCLFGIGFGYRFQN